MTTTPSRGHAFCAWMVAAALIFCVPARVYGQRLDHVGIDRLSATAVAARPTFRSEPLESNADAASKRRSAMIGGIIGGVVGAVGCTAFATVLNDSAEGGVRACPASTLVFFVSGGLVIGALVGWFVG